MSYAQPLLYEGERLETINGRPVLYKYSPRIPDVGESTQLVVFVPGAENLARIAYGGHANHFAPDFLCYWLNRKGFHFLAVSYPLESHPTIMPPDHGDVSASEWGQVTAEVASRTMQEHGLKKELILLCWSMGGKILKPFMREAHRLAIEVPLFISLAATPGGMTGLRATPVPERSAAGYAHRPGADRSFLLQIHEMEQLNRGRKIIGDDIYRKEYFGNTPIRLASWGLTERGPGPFIEDEWEGLRECGPEHTDYAKYPWIGAIHGNSPADLRHLIVDKATWGMVLTYKLLNEIVKNQSGSSGHARSAELMKFVHRAPDQMHCCVDGNHFFFLGEEGAKATAVAISEFAVKAKQLSIEFGVLLGQ